MSGEALQKKTLGEHLPTGQFYETAVARVKQRDARERHDGVGGDPQIVERNDAKKSARIEPAEIVGRAARLQQNAADQKAREHEEEVHAAPAEAKPTADEPDGARLAGRW